MSETVASLSSSVFTSSAKKLEANSAKCLVSKGQQLLGFVAKVVIHKGKEDILFYQISNGTKYVPGRDYVYSSKPSSHKISVWVYHRTDNRFLSKAALHLMDSPENVSDSLKGTVSFPLTDIYLILEPGLTEAEKSIVFPKRAPEPVLIKDAPINVVGKTVHTSVGNFELVDRPPAPAPLVSSRSGTVVVSFSWNYPGSVVYVTGSFSHWTAKYRLHEEGPEKRLITRFCLEPGTYQYKFIVDDEWRYDEARPFIKDGKGNINNEVVVVVPRGVAAVPVESCEKAKKQKQPQPQKQEQGQGKQQQKKEKQKQEQKQEQKKEEQKQETKETKASSPKPQEQPKDQPKGKGKQKKEAQPQPAPAKDDSKVKEAKARVEELVNHQKDLEHKLLDASNDLQEAVAHFDSAKELFVQKRDISQGLADKEKAIQERLEALRKEKEEKGKVVEEMREKAEGLKKEAEGLAQKEVELVGSIEEQKASLQKVSGQIKESEAKRAVNQPAKVASQGGRNQRGRGVQRGGKSVKVYVPKSPPAKQEPQEQLQVEVPEPAAQPAPEPVSQPPAQPAEPVVQPSEPAPTEPAKPTPEQPKNPGRAASGNTRGGARGGRKGRK
eukprot:TRINITY_DN2027_c0_g1_i1.p1 TRINITY_DN2027_c0_g1~~TRINITY_DN2027_c0_g1_i1.p1  ORF type:complete len:609 (-),score=197.38 TRINITY_DN2027_c0_g1_i1:14-1840(-)